jgi:AraC family transcriptional regulator of adaptative response/methylated-DNA-[protein]-cysteine methyltransferase
MKDRASTSKRAGNFSRDSDRWRAVQQNDAAADGQFYYAVRSTGIYCRPSCPSRLPQRENVRFFHTPEAAEAAGFRPCKRCSPNGEELLALHRRKIAAACQMLERADRPIKLAELASKAGMSRFHFHRVFKEITGSAPKAYALARRLERVRNELAQGGTVTSAIYGAGYNSSSGFYRRDSHAMGMKPLEYRKGGAGLCIRYGVALCSLGAVLAAATAKGICAILLGDDPQELPERLREMFPRAELQPAGAEFEATLAQVVAFADNPRGRFDLPLDLQGSLFQQRVWEALCQIPCGQTRSYSEIAQAIGAPSAARAVASACASNRVALAIPCHRVVHRDGSLSGYRWGTARKAQLLKAEGCDARHS